MEIGIGQRSNKKTMNTKYEILKKMLYIRLVEEKIRSEYIKQEMRCPIHLSIGQESAAVAVCNNLKKSDKIFTNHRCHAHYLAKNGNLEKMIAELYGRKTGCCKGRGGSMHLFDNENGIPLSIPIVGSAIPIAVGAALQSKLDKSKCVNVVFFGDGAVEEGTFHESLNFASLNKLPIIFVCENNLYSVYTNIIERQPIRNISKLAESHNIKSFDYQGYNTLDMHNSIKKIIAKCRKNQEPFFLNINTYRYFEHCGPNNDDHLKYRSKKEIDFWNKKDPLNLMIKNIKDNKAISDLNKFIESKNRYINKIFDKVKKSPLPSNKEINRYIYAK